MLKREITYEDFDGEEVTEVFYFNISKPELVELEVENKEGMEATIQKIIKTEDNKTLVQLFKRLILLAYGQKSEDGKRFIKSEQLAEEFSQTAAYSTLFMELASDDGAAVKFIQGILPRDMRGDIEKAVETTNDPTATKSVPPPPPSKPTKSDA